MTNGHLDVLKAAWRLSIRLCGHRRPARQSTAVLVDERAALIRESVAGLGADGERIKVVTFDGLVVDAARSQARRS